MGSTKLFFGHLGQKIFFSQKSVKIDFEVILVNLRIFFFLKIFFGQSQVGGNIGSLEEMSANWRNCKPSWRKRGKLEDMWGSLEDIEVKLEDMRVELEEIYAKLEEK